MRKIQAYDQNTHYIEAKQIAMKESYVRNHKKFDSKNNLRQ